MRFVLNSIFIIILYHSAYSLYSKEFVSASIAGTNKETLIANDDILIVGFNRWQISIFKDNDFLIRFDETLFEDFLGQKFNNEIYEFEYDYIDNTIYYQVGKDLLSFDINKNELSIVKIKSINYTEFYPNGNLMYFIDKNNLIEYDISKKQIINTYPSFDNLKDFNSISEEEVSFKYDNSIYRIRNGEISKIYDFKNLEIGLNTLLKLNNSKYYIVFQDIDEYFKLQVLDLEKNKVVDKLPLNNSVSQAYGIINSKIYYSNQNYLLESFNLENLEREAYEISCSYVFGNENLFAFEGRSIVSLDNFEPKQITFGYNNSVLRYIEKHNENYLVITEDESSTTIINILDLSKGNDLVASVRVNSRNYSLSDNILCYESLLNNEIYCFDLTTKVNSKVNYFDNLENKKLTSILKSNELLIVSYDNRIEILNMNSKSITEIATDQKISNIITIDESKLFVAFETIDNSEKVNLGLINLDNEDVLTIDTEYFKFNIINRKYYIYNGQIIVKRDAKTIDFVNMYDLKIDKSIILDLEFSTITIDNERIFVNNDSVIYEINDDQITKSYEFEKNYNIFDAERRSGIRDFNITNDELYLLDKENIIWKYNFSTTNIKQLELEKFSDLDNLNKNQFIAINAFDVSGKLVQKFESVTDFKNFYETNKNQRLIVSVITDKEEFLLKLINF